tara:strand:- start:406 stop:519 length:114 start_codon:yes stop_codon:yes gene_type:complete
MVYPLLKGCKEYVGRNDFNDEKELKILFLFADALLNF